MTKAALCCSNNTREFWRTSLNSKLGKSLSAFALSGFLSAQAGEVGRSMLRSSNSSLAKQSL